MVHTFRYKVNDAVWYRGRVGRIEDAAIDATGREVYLVQLTNHQYRWANIEDLKEYLG